MQILSRFQTTDTGLQNVKQRIMFGLWCCMKKIYLQCNKYCSCRWSKDSLYDMRSFLGHPEPGEDCVWQVQHWRSQYTSPDSCSTSAWPTYREILPWRYKLARPPPGQTTPGPSAYWREFPGVTWMLWISKQPEFFCRRYWTLWISCLWLIFPNCSHTPPLSAEIKCTCQILW